MVHVGFLWYDQADKQALCMGHFGHRYLHFTLILYDLPIFAALPVKVKRVVMSCAIKQVWLTMTMQIRS